MTEIKSNVFYCTICQFPEEALPNAYRVRPYVNEIVVVHNKPVMDQVKAEFDELDATLHYVDWKEDFSYKRTQYIRKTGDIIQEKGSEKGYTKNNTWMLISDTDEFPSISLLSNLQSIIAKAEIGKFSICTINSHDYLTKGEGTNNPFTVIPRPLEDISENEIVGHSISSYHKELLVRYQDRLEYTGKVHHTLRGTGLRIMQAPKEYYYDHIKKDADLHSHGCRNWFIGGGGVQEFSEKWKVLRSITDKYGIDSWEKMEERMKIGNMQSDVLQFFVDHKDDNETASDSEIRSFYTYYKTLHENELVGIVQNIRTVITNNKVKVQKFDLDNKCGVDIKAGVNMNANENVNIKDEITDEDIKKNTINGLYYDPSWRKEYTKKAGVINKENKESKEPPKKLVDTSKPLYNFQEVKVSSDSSNTPKIETMKVETSKIEIPKTEIQSRSPFPSEKLNVPLESEEEIYEFVEDIYNTILGRTSDSGGVKNYVNAIKEGRLKKENLAKIFRLSDEYKEKGLDT